MFEGKIKVSFTCQAKDLEYEENENIFGEEDFFIGVNYRQLAIERQRKITLPSDSVLTITDLEYRAGLNDLEERILDLKKMWMRRAYEEGELRVFCYKKEYYLKYQNIWYMSNCNRNGWIKLDYANEEHVDEIELEELPEELDFYGGK